MAGGLFNQRGQHWIIHKRPAVLFNDNRTKNSLLLGRYLSNPQQFAAARFARLQTGHLQALERAHDDFGWDERLRVRDKLFVFGKT
jgi:hypothetical protein